MQYTKRPIDHQRQIQLLRQRGLIIKDEDKAIRQLRIIGYFRLSAYLQPMEENDATYTFRPGSTFKNAVNLYYFDKKLRQLIFQLIQGIEVALRAKVTHLFSMQYGPFWFTDANLALSAHNFQDNLSRVESELRRSKEEFIHEHLTKYTSPDVPPAWKTIEILSLGLLSKLLCNFSDKPLKKAVAKEFCLPRKSYLESWIKTTVGIRNIVAHHGRLWNRSLPSIPILPPKLPGKWIEVNGLKPEKLYAQLSTLLYMENQIHPDNTFVRDFKRLLSEYPSVDVTAMGFPANWKKEPLWQRSRSKCLFKRIFCK